MVGFLWEDALRAFSPHSHTAQQNRLQILHQGPDRFKLKTTQLSNSTAHDYNLTGAVCSGPNTETPYIAKTRRSARKMAAVPKMERHPYRAAQSTFLKFRPHFCTSAALRDFRYSMMAKRSSGESAGPTTPFPRGPSLNSCPRLLLPGFVTS